MRGPGRDPGWRAAPRTDRRPRPPRPTTTAPHSWKWGSALTTRWSPGRPGSASVRGPGPAPGRRALVGLAGTRSRGTRALRSSAAATAGSGRPGPVRRRPSAERSVPGSMSKPAAWARSRETASRRGPPAGPWRRDPGCRRPQGRPGPGTGPGAVDTGRAAAPAPEAARAAAGSVAAGPRSSAAGRSAWPPYVRDGSRRHCRRHGRCRGGDGTSHRRRRPEDPAAGRRRPRLGRRGAPWWCWPWWRARWCSSSCPGPAYPAAHRRRAPC